MSFTTTFVEKPLAFWVGSTIVIAGIAGAATAAGWSGTIAGAVGTGIGIVTSDAGSIGDSIQEGREAAGDPAPAAPVPAQ